MNVVYTTTIVIPIVDELLIPFYDFRRVIIGHQPLLVCEEKKEQMEKQEAFSSLHHIFLKFEVVSPYAVIRFIRWLIYVIDSDLTYQCIYSSECVPEWPGLH